MYKSNELVILKDITTGELTRIRPGTEFELPDGDYINLNEARLCTDGKTALILKAGENVQFGKPQGKGNRKPVEKKQVKKILKKEPVLLEADND